ncbi:hypothetical protein [Campylobacter estrildidarum]|uniref:Ferrochelatase n=1 Tax=Campylobacter estrildidarum TaxID=2510189 RepID=A0A4U7BQJ3_9BACT|nr:hypothetical protein [Campylobacter estrildidarum]TKX30934.1 hypothetical protein CQA69_04330 [Campylobacter estrildidarum]
MNISNLIELLNAKLIQEGSILSIGGFALSLDEVKPSYAFFCNDKNKTKEAIQKGAYAIIYEKDIKIIDKELYYLKVQDLENALFRLFRFLCEEKECKFLLCSKRELNFCKVFFLKTLYGNIFLDFNSLIKAKKGDFFCFNEKEYLLKIATHYETLENIKLTKFENSTPFYSSFICDDLYFKKLNLPFLYIEIFSQFVNFCKKNQLKIHFNLNNLDLFKIYFVNEAMQIVEFGTSTRAFIVLENEEEMEFWQEKFKDFNGFKTALKNSLFCDFSYNEIKDLKKFKDFTYCAVLANINDFENAFKISDTNTPSLF